MCHQPWHTQDDVEPVIQIEDDELVLEAFILDRVVDDNYTLVHPHCGPIGETDLQSRRLDLLLLPLEGISFECFASNKVVRCT